MAQDYVIQFLAEMERDIGRIADDLSAEYLSQFTASRQVREIERRVAVELEKLKLARAA